jgi:hypothetical protein
MEQIAIFFIVTAVVLLAGCAIRYAYQQNVGQQESLEEQGNIPDCVKWVTDLIDRGQPLKLLCDQTPGIVLQSNEELLDVFPLVTLMEPRAVRTFHGVFGGPSVRIAKGMSLRFGGYAGSSESHDELRAVDEGTLVLTSQRLTFVGQGRTFSVALEKIVSMEGYDDRLQLNRRGKEKVEHFKFSGRTKMTYPCDGSKLSVRISGHVVKLLISQAIHRWLNPLSTLPSTDARPVERNFMGIPRTVDPQGLV